MRYLSLCSGIEAATVAWHAFGWTPVAFSEIEAFPCALLQARYPDVPNWGDMTSFQEWPDAAIDVLVGGTPCQSFSVAGPRKGLADPRGNLALTYLAVVDRYRPQWVVWENVPGVLSSNGGRDFGAFLGGLAELGYGWAYRVLDAQYFGVAQRRRRVFVVGCLGGWTNAAAVLFERHSLSGHPPPRRETGQDVTGTLGARTRSDGGFGTDFECAGGLIASTGHVAHCLNAGGMGRRDYEPETMVVHAFDARQSDVLQYGDKTGPLDTDGHSVAMAFNFAGGSRRSFHVKPVDVAACLGTKSQEPNECTQNAIMTVIQPHMGVRRLTPRECERLQGFPDDYTLIRHRGKPAADGPRYKALGNSMAVPVMRWLGQRLAQVDAILQSEPSHAATVPSCERRSAGDDEHTHITAERAMRGVPVLGLAERRAGSVPGRRAVP